MVNSMYAQSAPARFSEERAAISASEGQIALGTNGRQGVPAPKDRKRVLLVAADPTDLHVLRFALRGSELDVVEALTARLPPRESATGFDIALAAIGNATCRWDLVLRDIRSRTDAPVLCLLPVPSRDEIEEFGLLDADDILFLPLRPDELLARMSLLLWKKNHKEKQTWPLIERRRRGVGQVPMMASAVSCQPTDERFLIDDREKTVKIGTRVIHLSPKEYRLLRLLASDPGRIFSVTEIAVHLWAKGQHTPAKVHQCVYQLRKKLKMSQEGPEWVLNAAGFGYKIRLAGE